MVGLSQSVSEVISIMRKVTGRTDADDPQFTDSIMFGYLQDFIQLEHPNEIRIYQNKTWYEFTISEFTPDPLPITLSSSTGPNPSAFSGTQSGYSSIEPPCYIGGFEVFWYQNPTQFYRIWPETNTYQPSRPTYVLYYNQELVFRAPPNAEYTFKVAAYHIPEALRVEGQLAENSAYLARYLAYGTALDIFSDYGEMDRVAEVMPQYKRYKGQVVAQTWCQMMNQRTTPTF